MKQKLFKDNTDLVVFGSFGFGNIGDEAVSYAIQDLLAEIDYQARVHILSRFDRPDMNAVVGLGDDYLSERSRLYGAPGILVGGGIIEPRTMCCALRYAPYIEGNKPLSSSIFMGSFEFGVKYGWLIKRRLNEVFEQFDHIYTRDYLSELYLRETFPEVQVTTVSDVVLAMRPSTGRPLPEEISTDNYIVVSLCGAWRDDENWYKWIIEELVNLSNNLSKKLLFLPMSCHQSDDDRIEHQKIMNGVMDKRVKLRPIAMQESLHPRDFAAVTRDSALVISMRLHGCVIAYAQKTPFVGLSYHPKLTGFSLTVGWRNFILPLRQPVRQSRQKYGYKFSDLGFCSNDLYQSALKALEYSNFSLLPNFRANLKASLQVVLKGGATHSN